ncbi:MAG TPA: hypothetical protein VIW80_19580 [Pyrinomonadaceae bacterium]|jgi:hypothetical protein
MPTSINLPLNLDSEQQFKIFINALGDERVRSGLSSNREDLPKGVSEVIRMSEDEEFLSQALEVASLYTSLLKGTTRIETLKEAGKRLHTYTIERYPDGFQLLEEYGNKAIPKQLNINAMASEARADVAANVEAVVNAAVWANAAAVTQVAVAAVAVIVVGVFVI